MVNVLREAIKFIGWLPVGSDGTPLSYSLGISITSPEAEEGEVWRVSRMFFRSVAGIVGSDNVMLFRGPDSLFVTTLGVSGAKLAESATIGGVGERGV